MNVRLDKGRPVGPQICEAVCVAVVKGEYPAGQRLPSVRELAVTLGVNPNTVQHAMETMGEQGILYSVRGSGWYVQEDVTRATEVLEALRLQKMRDFFETMRLLGLSADQTKKRIKEWDYE